MATRDGRDDPGAPDPGAAWVAEFIAWSADARADEASSGRRREAWLRRQAGEGATLVGLLVDLAENGREVTLTTRSQRVVGRVSGIGRDVAAVVRAGSVTLVALAHLVAVSAPGPPAAAGDRAAGTSWSLDDALGVLTGETVRVALATGEAVTGTLVAVGADHVTLRLAATSLHVALDAVETVAPG